jgi:hypothetical protein
MTARCSFADDHDLGSPALAEHAAGCEACASRVALRTLARETWSAAKRWDDRTARSARERRLMSVAGAARARRRGIAWSAAFGGALVGATLLVVALRHSGLHLPSETATSPDPAMPSTAPLAQAVPAAVESASTASRTTTPRFRVVDVQGGHASREGAVLEVGDTLNAGDAIDVAPRVVVRLLWAIDLGDEGDAQAPPAVEVVGPADVSVGEGSSPLLVLRSGVARVTAGRVAVGRQAEAPSEVVAGHTIVVDPADRARAGRVAPVVENDASECFRLADRAIAEGNRGEAESTLRALLEHAQEPDVRARAALRLAELLLARGASREARMLLEPVAFGREPRRAADAAWLYARSLPTPEERASAWARYLATSPPPAMRALAMVERASALLDARDVNGARRIAAELDEEVPGSVAADARRGLEARLARER